MTTETSDLLLPGYWVDPVSGAWCSLPWPQDPDEKLALVNSSLGPAIIDWAEGRSGEPGLINYQTGEPWTYTPGQKRFLILWYHVDEDGRFTYRTGVKRGAKGTGKDPFAASMCNAEMLGPVELYDWDERTGRPVGRPRGFPLVQVISNSLEQSKDVLRIANGMWSQDARDYYGIDCGETRTILKNGGGRFEVPPTSEGTAEGDPATFIALNETHHMTESSGGSKVARTAYRNVGKSPKHIQARVCEFTNAHRPGQDSTAEGAFNAWQKQMSPKYRGKRDILYDSIEAPPDTDILTEEGRVRGLRAAYMDAPWNDIERISAEMVDDRTPVADTIRFYLNGLAAAEDAWVDPQKFDLLARSGEVVADREQIAMFLDCSKTDDDTGLVACRLVDGHTWVLGHWCRPKGGKEWKVPRHEVDAEVREAMRRYRVVWFGVDPSPAQDDDTEALYWADLIDAWHRDFGARLPLWATPGANIGHAVKFDMRLSQRGGVERNRLFTEMAELVAEWIDEDRPEGVGPQFTHDGDTRLRRHVHNARNRPNQWGVSLSKETRSSTKKVDLAVCMVGAQLGRRIALNSSKVRLTGERRVRKAVIG
ncbi:terminase [Mycobacterium phage TChen]|uniref:Terminase n=1 Tax=Mycobacterium phage TChen TaxID=2163598 RepID=A0A2S1PCX2_9CAUD|nr:terminase [Mycobacterium phage TChen]AWH14403.1 terminase [Mycobacterium phage TChen]